MAELIPAPTRIPVPGGKLGYSTLDAETEYVAVCLPAFEPGLANRDSE